MKSATNYSRYSSARRTKARLELVDDGKFLLNPRNGYKYPIRNGIPVMLIEEGKKYQDKSLIQSNGSGKASETASAS